MCTSTEAPDWEVDHNGKIVKIPRPVHGLRVWNAQKASYDEISPVMAGEQYKLSFQCMYLQYCFNAYINVNIGAPSPTEMSTAWAALLEELGNSLNPKYGEDFIHDCVHMNEDDVKAKYFQTTNTTVS